MQPTDPTVRETKRMRRARRDIARIERHKVWVANRLKAARDPAELENLRRLLRDLASTGLAPRSGLAFQESRLPLPDGPPECWLCHTFVGGPVPVRYQRLFEDELRANPGRSNLAVWRSLGYHQNQDIKRGGRGFVTLGRLSHSEHVDLYEEWRTDRDRAPASR